MREKGDVLVVILVLVVVLIGLGVAAYFFLLPLNEVKVVPVSSTNTPTLVSTEQPTSGQIDETANWKTYTGQKLGFSIRYPKEWSKPKETLGSSESYVNFNNEKTNLLFQITVEQNNLSYLEIAKQEGDYRIEPKLITVDSQPAAYVKMRDEDLRPPKPNPFVFVSIQKGNKVYSMIYSLSLDLEKQQSEQKIFNQILSTFKFLD